MDTEVTAPVFSHRFRDSIVDPNQATWELNNPGKGIVPLELDTEAIGNVFQHKFRDGKVLKGKLGWELSGHVDGIVQIAPNIEVSSPSRASVSRIEGEAWLQQSEIRGRRSYSRH
jgi:hypothetical protein